MVAAVIRSLGCRPGVAVRSLGCIGYSFAAHTEGRLLRIVAADYSIVRIAVFDRSPRIVDKIVRVGKIVLQAGKYWLAG